MSAINKLTLGLNADYEQLAPVVRTLLHGGVVAAPTQSFYALMVMADNHQGLDRLEILKPGRQEKAFLLLLDSAARATCYAREVPQEAKALMERFWPGLLSLLFLAQPGLHSSLVGPARTVGLRVEGLHLVRRLVRLVDRGLTGTSANLPGQKPPTTITEVEAYFGDKVDLYLDCGPTNGNMASTIIDVSLGAPRLLRDGALAINELEAACPLLRL